MAAFDPYYKWLGIPPAEQPPNLYRLLGVTVFEDDPDVIHSAADRQIAHLESHRSGDHGKLAGKLIERIERARLTLNDRRKRAAYEKKLRQELRAIEPPVPPPPPPTPPPVPTARMVSPVPEPEPEALIRVEPVSRLPARRRSSWLAPVVVLGTVAGVGVLGALFLLGDAGEPLAEKSPVPPSESEPKVQKEPVTPTDPTPEPADQSPAKDVSPDKVPEPVPVRPADPVDTRTPDDSQSPTSEPEPAPAETPPEESKRPPRRTLDELLRQKREANVRPVPTKEKLAAATALVAEIYKQELDAAQKPEEKAKLARKLYNQGTTTQDDTAAKYVLYLRSADLYVESKQFSSAWDVLDAVRNQYDTSVLARKDEVLRAAGRTAKLPGDFKVVAEGWISLLNEAISQNQFDAALKFADEARRVSHRTNDEVLQRLVDNGVSEIRQLAAAYNRAQAAEKALDQDPNNPDAALAWGMFVCAYKNQWVDGLPILSKAGDGPIARLAQNDLARPSANDAKLQLADGWWAEAEAAEDSLAQKFLKQRAVYWYKQAVGGLAGLAKARIQKRITDFEEATAVLPVGEFIDVLGLVNPARHTVRGSWGRLGANVGVARASTNATVMIPVGVRGSYDLQVRFKMTKGTELCLVFPAGDRQGVLGLGAYGGNYSLLYLTPSARTGKSNTAVPEPLRGNPAAASSSVVTNRLHTLSLKVEVQDSSLQISADLDGRGFIRWKGDQSQLESVSSWTIPNTAAFGLGANRSLLVLQSVRLKLADGATARLLD